MSSVKTKYLVCAHNSRMDKKFCNNLKSVRKQLGMTQRQVAERLGVVESCYANWEQGRTEPNVEMLRNLGKLFDVSIDDLIND